MAAHNLVRCFTANVLLGVGEASLKSMIPFVFTAPVPFSDADKLQLGDYFSEPLQFSLCDHQHASCQVAVDSWSWRGVKNTHVTVHNVLFCSLIFCYRNLNDMKHVRKNFGTNGGRIRHATIRLACTI